MTDHLLQFPSIVRPTVNIVASFVGRNAVALQDLASLIDAVHGALSRVVAKPEAEPAAAAPRPAVPIKKSVQPDYLICLNDGKRFKSLKRHLRSKYGLTPEEYRDYWGLPATYPMVAPGYARERSQLAKAMGLGQQRRRHV